MTITETAVRYICTRGECHTRRWPVCCQACEERGRCDLACRYADLETCEGKTKINEED